MTTAISLHETLSGSSQKGEFAVQNLAQNIDIMPFTKEDAITSASIFRQLAKQGKKINALDILIAGICISKKATLITLDNDFKRVPGLKVVGV